MTFLHLTHVPFQSVQATGESGSTRVWKGGGEILSRRVGCDTYEPDPLRTPRQNT